MEELKDKIVEIVDHYLRHHDLMTGEDAAHKILSLIEKTEPVAEVPCSDRVSTLFDKLEEISEKVHDAWWEEKRAQQFHAPQDCPDHDGFAQKFTKCCDHCHADMYPYNELPTHVQEYDRVTVRAVLNAIGEAC